MTICINGSLKLLPDILCEDVALAPASSASFVAEAGAFRTPQGFLLGPYQEILPKNVDSQSPTKEEE